ncbi:MAG: hypothetical protein ACRDPG_10905, partial [Nocardioidaceae bacterium]
MRRRILLVVVGMTTLVVLGFAIPLALVVKSSIEDHALRQAQDEAQALAYFVSAGQPRPGQIHDYLVRSARTHVGELAVELPDGTIVGANGHDPGRPDGDGDADDNAPPGYISGPSTSNDVGGKLIEVRASTSGGTVTISDFLSDDALHAGLVRWLLLIGAVSLGLIGLSAAAAELLSGRLVRSLTET